MANLVDYLYFFGEILIPELNVESKRSALNIDIGVYQKEILIDVLGYELYTLFIAGLAAETVIYKDIRDGKVFTFELNGKTITRKWNGLINTEKISLISDFTYYKITERKVSHSTAIGEVIPDAENAVRSNSTDKMVNAWYRMREMYGITPRGFVKITDSDYVHYNDLPSLYNFLLANTDVYPTWEFEPKNSVSGFGY